jgi:hypothetical protein
MTAPIQILLAGSPDGFQPFTATLGDSKAGANAANGSLTIKADGSITLVGASSSVGPVAAWFTPVGTPPATWVRLTFTGSPPTFGTVGTPIPTSSAPAWSWVPQSVTTLSGSGTINFYSDAGATQLLSSNPISVSVTRTA